MMTVRGTDGDNFLVDDGGDTTLVKEQMAYIHCSDALGTAHRAHSFMVGTASLRSALASG